MKKLTSMALLATTCVLSPAALAHAGHHDVSHWYSGLLHPLTGIDHLLTMLLMGVVAARLSNGQSKVLLSMIALSFVGGMLLTSLFTAPATIEYLMMASVVLVPLAGLAIGRHHLLEAVSFVALALFGGAHGFVQGSEASGSVIMFSVGAVISSMMTCVAGLALARLAQTRLWPAIQAN
ncbi:HupE/UreJ family protein [Neiella sp. HB171785]|uniref:HupE/UreJ family protein n=1 Tax=Neiella litorisoli TaxID=2771431 RepID=A0A8J6UDQ0_9GAMM|nr:HupE/UreJ family protein [Neiella litorisoli]MBD1388304.1 HupE/UreJ family protein [Neiella litorisoli]